MARLKSSEAVRARGRPYVAGVCRSRNLQEVVSQTAILEAAAIAANAHNQRARGSVKNDPQVVGEVARVGNFHGIWPPPRTSTKSVKRTGNSSGGRMALIPNKME